MVEHPTQQLEDTVGLKVKGPAIAECWDEFSRCELVYTCRWKETEASIIVKTMNTVGCIKHIGRSPSSWKHRLVIATDNLASLAALGKGRSSSRRMLYLTRQAAAYVIGYGMKVFYRFVPSARNKGDGPSRGRGIGYLDQRTGRLCQ